MLEEILQYIKNNFIPIIIAFLIGVTATLFVKFFGEIKSLFVDPEKKKEQDRKLRIHFEEIKQEATQIVDSCIHLTDYYGMILMNRIGLTIDWSDYISKFGLGLLPELSTIFTAHFAKDTAEIARLRMNIEKHNKRRVELDYRVKSDFGSQNIPLLNINNSSNRPFYVYDTIFRPLFLWWQACNREETNPRPNFNKIGTKADGEPNNLYVEGWGSQAIAYAKTDYGKNKCKHAIHDIAHNEEYQMYASWLIRLSDSLVREVHEFAQQLSNILDSVERFWPGTKSYRFTKEKKKCPECKEIFS